MKVRRGAIALTYAAMLFLLIGLITSCSTAGTVTHIYKMQGGRYGLTLDKHPGALYLFGGSASYQVGDRVTFSTRSARSDDGIVTGIEINGDTFNEIRIIEGNNQ